MSRSLPITEDTPPDMLAGAMDLRVVLPNGRDLKMSVERSTPMMDLLVHITTANKMSPGGHLIQAVGDRGVLPYKPSTPIGALDTWTIHIVPKKQASNVQLKKPYNYRPVYNTPFEQTFRLQVHLPRNQLYVTRISYKTRLSDIFQEVCKEKNLTESKYCLIHPENANEELDLTKTFMDYKIQQVNLVSKANRSVGLSSVDIMAIKRYEDENQRKNKNSSHSYDGSVSSGSLEGRSLSPVRSEESSSSPTAPKQKSSFLRPYRKRRPAPKPPTQNELESRNGAELTINHSRNSSDSSGYHESSVLSESPESNSNSLADSLPRRSKLPSTDPDPEKDQRTSKSNSGGKITGNLSRSLSNLTGNNDAKSRMYQASGGMRQKAFAVSSTSLASLAGKKKKAPAPPPPARPQSMLSLQEESSSTPDLTKPPAPACKSPTVDRKRSVEPNSTVDNPSRGVPPVDSVKCDIPSNSVTRTVERLQNKDELTMADEEIDRIFDDATKGYDAPSLTVPPKSASQPRENGHDVKADASEDPFAWQYKLPSPPSAFRDVSSPLLTEYDTMTKGNLSEAVVTQKQTQNESNSRAIQTSDVVRSSKLKNCGRELIVAAVIEKESKCEPRKAEVLRISGSETRKLNENRKSYETQMSREKLFDTSTIDSGVGSDDSIPSVSERADELVRKRDAKAPRRISADSGSKPSKSPTIRRRESVLENFTISTYQNSKPTDIFRDESVKTSRTTQLAQSNHPSAKRPPSPRRVPAARPPTVKRSKSHISLLSGNFTKFEQLRKLRLEVDADDVDSGVECRRETSLRRTASDVSVNKDCNRGETELLELQDQVLKWKTQDKEFNVLNNKRNTTELQSVQVLKDILPQLNKTPCREHSSKAVSLSRSASVLESSKPDVSTNETERKPSNRLQCRLMETPAVNLQSWNDRPKRQVSIKLDRDYVYGKSSKPVQSTYTEHMECNEPSEVSRVPIVKSVEFKKPYKPVEFGKKARPSSCYLFGETVPRQESSDVQSKTRITVNTSNGYRSVVDLNDDSNHGFANRTNYTFKTYKSKLMENEKLNGIAKTNTKNTKPPARSFGVPPPPPVMPYNVSGCRKSYVSVDEDPRDVLMSAIKNFNKDNLRKLKVRACNFWTTVVELTTDNPIVAVIYLLTSLTITFYVLCKYENKFTVMLAIASLFQCMILGTMIALYYMKIAFNPAVVRKMRLYAEFLEAKRASANGDRKKDIKDNQHKKHKEDKKKRKIRTKDITKPTILYA